METRFTRPDGFDWGYFNSGALGMRVRYGHVAPPEATGTVVLAGGLGEPAEKYFEVIRERLAQKQAVWILDWPGQGGSQRFLTDEPMKAHHTGYGGILATLHQFLTDIVKRDPKAPLGAMMHSMGGHICLRYLAEYPGVFDWAAVTDPMIRFRTGLLPVAFARAIARAGSAAGLAACHVPGGGPWRPGRERFEGNQKTSDPVRFRVQPGLFLENEALRIGDPTFGWVESSFESCDILNEEAYLKSIITPVLMQISGNNGIVDRAAAVRASGLIPHCRRIDIPAAKHEIWMERDGLREAWLAEVNAFPGQCLRTPSPSRQGPPRPRKEG